MAVRGSHSEITINSSLERILFSLTGNSINNFCVEKKSSGKAQTSELFLQSAIVFETLYTVLSKSNWTRMKLDCTSFSLLNTKK